MRCFFTGILAILIIGNRDIVYAQRAGAMPHTIIYKTKKQYRYFVPVQLSADGKTVVSYPDPADIKTGSAGEIALPVPLHDGYWLDNRGVGKNTAFIKLTYTKYSQLKAVPTSSELYSMIIDKHPIKTICDCGIKGKYTAAQLNSFIDAKTLNVHCKIFK